MNVRKIHRRERQKERGGPFETLKSEQPNTSFSLLRISPPTPTYTYTLEVVLIHSPSYVHAHISRAAFNNYDASFRVSLFALVRPNDSHMSKVRQCQNPCPWCWCVTPSKQSKEMRIRVGGAIERTLRSLQ